jgi:hypothetical protein
MALDTSPLRWFKLVLYCFAVSLHPRNTSESGLTRFTKEVFQGQWKKYAAIRTLCKAAMARCLQYAGPTERASCVRLQTVSSNLMYWHPINPAGKMPRRSHEALIKLSPVKKGEFKLPRRWLYETHYPLRGRGCK